MRQRQEGYGRPEFGHNVRPFKGFFSNGLPDIMFFPCVK
jgi:hypothetical protein